MIKENNGIVVLEILIAMTIIIIAISSVSLLLFGDQSIFTGPQTHQEALYKARQVLEDAASSLKSDFDLDVSFLDSKDGIYTKSLIIIPSSDESTKKIISEIKWGNNMQVKLSTVVADLNSLSLCSPFFSGDFKNPQHREYYSYDLISQATGNNSDGLSISDIKEYRGKLYVAANATSNNGYTFYIFDLPEDIGQMPVYNGGVDNSLSVSLGLNALAISNGYAYVANAYTGSSVNCLENNNCAELQIININNPTNPFIARNFKISATASGSKLPAATSIFYKNGYVYIGLAKVQGQSQNGEFNVIDVGGGGAPASPTNPILKGTYFVGSTVNSIFVKGNLAYIASPNNENMTIVDIKVNSPTFMKRVGGYTPPVLPGSNGIGSNHGKSIYVVGKTAYLGRTYGTGEFYILNSENPSDILSGGYKDIGGGNQTTVNGMAVKNSLAFLLTNAQFQVWDIANPENIIPWTQDGTNNTFLSLSSFGGTGSSALYCSGDRFYAAIKSSQGSNKDFISILYPN